ncbi:MAG: cytochrome c [Parcubacteria group bacterium]|nr:cytochrome c [Parcubacteria group bacterium]
MKYRVVLCGIVAISVFVLISLQTALVESTNLDDEAMRQVGRLYQERCMFCHGVYGDGNGEIAKSLAVKPRNFTDYNEMRHLLGDQGAIEDVIRHGKSGVMPSFEGDLNRSEIKMLAYYVQAFQAREQFLINMCVGSVAKFEHVFSPGVSVLSEFQKLLNGKPMFSVVPKKSGFIEISVPTKSMMEMKLSMMLKSTQVERSYFIIQEGNINTALVTVRAHFPCPDYLKTSGFTVQKQF